MINHKLMRTEGVLILTPKDPLESTDFEQLAREIDPYIEANGNLHGVMIDAESFPGWKDFAALVAHLRFIENHHQKVQKIAVVSDSDLLSFAPKLASHFIQADIRHFPHSQREDALRWLTGDSH
jgi:SpoIIAA-like